MSLAEGQKALQTFHEWCDAQGIEYDKEAVSYTHLTLPTTPYV